MDPMSADPGERIVVPLHEETLEATVRPVDQGVVRIHKRVEEVPAERLVEVGRDEIAIERVRVDRPVEAAPEPWYEGETLVIPVIEEELVTQTRLVVREEIRVTRRRVAEQQSVRDTVRREIIEIEDATE